MWAPVKRALRSFFGAHFVSYHIVIVTLYVLTWTQINNYPLKMISETEKLLASRKMVLRRNNERYLKKEIAYVPQECASQNRKRSLKQGIACVPHEWSDTRVGPTRLR